MASFVSYYLSVRNEPTVTPARFDSIVRAKVKRMSVPPQVKVYLQYKLGDIWPSSSRGVANILQVEQTTSIIDLYETFIKVAQHLLSKGSSSIVLGVTPPGRLKENRNSRPFGPHGNFEV
jgi:hypothetical protein